MNIDIKKLLSITTKAMFCANKKEKKEAIIAVTDYINKSSKSKKPERN